MRVTISVTGKVMWVNPMYVRSVSAKAMAASGVTGSELTLADGSTLSVDEEAMALATVLLHHWSPRK